MEKLDGYWVKPFASGMSCIDTVTGDCKRGSSVEECMEICQRNALCDAGYHVSFKDLPLQSYCLPLNTTMYKNTNFLNNLITPDNKTRLSRDNGVDLTIFYNPKRFPPDMDLLKSRFVFHGDTCFLAQKSDQSGSLLFLHSDFSFRPEQSGAQPLTLGENNNLVFDFDVRINKQSTIHFFRENSLAILTWTDNTWSFSPYVIPGLGFMFEDVPQDFVDYGTPFLLKSSGLGYLCMNDKNELSFCQEKPQTPFIFVYDANNSVNASIRKPWKEKAMSDDQNFKKNNGKFPLPKFSKLSRATKLSSIF